MASNDRKEAERRLRELEYELEKLLKDEQRSFREVVNLGVQNSRISSLYKKAVSILVDLACESDRDVLVCKSLRQFESMVQQDAAIEAQNEALKRIEFSLKY